MRRCSLALAFVGLASTALAAPPYRAMTPQEHGAYRIDTNYLRAATTAGALPHVWLVQAAPIGPAATYEYLAVATYGRRFGGRAYTNHARSQAGLPDYRPTQEHRGPVLVPLENRYGGRFADGDDPVRPTGGRKPAGKGRFD